MSKKLIFLELNEINFDLLQIYSKSYKFKVFNNKFFENLKNTESEKSYDLLEPWIQWVSIHTGLDAKEHNIFRLGDVENLKKKQIFEEIEDYGFSVGAICPMNAKNNLKNSKYFLPDPWTKNQNPKSFAQNMIYSSLSEAVNNNSGNQLSFISILSILISFIYFVRVNKYLNLLKLLINVFNNKWNKALIFDFLINEIHIKYIDKYKKDFSTIFFNAGAHIQHHYLHNSKVLEKSKKNPEWYIKEKKDPILDAYKFYDNLIYEYMNMKNYSILIATGLTQIPYEESTYYYRLSNHKEFLKLLEIDFYKLETRMSRDFLIYFKDHQTSKLCANKFEKINKLNNKKIFNFDNRGSSIFVSFAYDKEILNNTQIKISKDINIKLKEHVNFVAIKNGKHTSKGFIYTKGDISKINFLNGNHIKNINYLIKKFFK